MKKLFRSAKGKNRMIGGVCSGIAEYFEIDPTIVRLSFMFFFLFGSFSLWVYLISWIIIPEEQEEV
jgi:phage shock protein PspC (stress-responsive transcriptional regulator)